MGHIYHTGNIFLLSNKMAEFSAGSRNCDYVIDKWKYKKARMDPNRNLLKLFNRSKGKIEKLKKGKNSQRKCFSKCVFTEITLIELSGERVSGKI